MLVLTQKPPFLSRNGASARDDSSAFGLGIGRSTSFYPSLASITSARCRRSSRTTSYSRPGCWQFRSSVLPQKGLEEIEFIADPTVGAVRVRCTEPEFASIVSAAPASRRRRAPKQGSASGPDQARLRRPHPFRSSSEVYDFTHARWRALKLPIPTLHRYSVWRVLREIADPVGHSRGPGRPWLWRLKTPAADATSASSD